MSVSPRKRADDVRQQLWQENADNGALVQDAKDWSEYLIPPGSYLLTADQAETVREGVRLLGELAWVSHEGDPWYAEREGINVAEVRQAEIDALALLSPEASAPKCYCGDLTWTVRKHGRVTHKEHCPARTDPWHQGDPTAEASTE